MLKSQSSFIEIMIGVATGGILAILSQYFSNNSARQVSKYSAYEDFAVSINRSLRMVQDIDKHMKRMKILDQKIEEFEALQNSSQTTESELGFEKLVRDKDELGVDTSLIIEKSEALIKEVDRSLSRVQLNGSTTAVKIGQKLYFEMGERGDDQSLKINSEELFNEFLLEAKLDLSHPYLSKIPVARFVVLSMNRKKKSFRSNSPS